MLQPPAMAVILSALMQPAGNVAPSATPPEGATTLPAVPWDDGLLNVDLIEVKGFRFRGNTALSDSELHRIADEMLQKDADKLLSLEQLQQIADALSAAYVERGYINSGAILPDQSVPDGIVVFELVEGRLSQVEVSPVELERGAGKLRLRRGYVQDRILRSAGPPLNVNRLRDELELLRQDPSIQRVNAELKTTGSAGMADLLVKIEDAPLLTLALSFNNHHNVSTGPERLELFGTVRNPTGFGDQLAFRYSITEGGFDEIDLAGLDAFSVSYRFPLTPSGTSLGFSVDRSNEPLIEEEFESLDITSDTISYAVYLHHPLYRAPNRELAVFVAGTYRTNETTLLGERFPVSPGASDDGQTSVTAIRLGAELNLARADDAVALRSTISIGTDWFGATNNRDGLPDSQFVAWLGQAQYVRRLGQTNNRVSIRGTAQLASDVLLPLEQYSLGGATSVRGYRENRLVQDNGMFVSAELLLPVTQVGSAGRSILEIVPFFDAGYASNRSGLLDLDQEHKFICSAGVGLIFTPIEPLRATVFYGYPFQDFDDQEHDLQDVGVHFDVTLSFNF